MIKRKENQHLKYGSIMNKSLNITTLIAVISLVMLCCWVHRWLLVHSLNLSVNPVKCNIHLCDFFCWFVFPRIRVELPSGPVSYFGEAGGTWWGSKVRSSVTWRPVSCIKPRPPTESRTMETHGQRARADTVIPLILSSAWLLLLFL